ncbi:MAG: MaoC family dehydratase N-terminal domain-containing protein [Actinomycetota bacterium]
MTDVDVAAIRADWAGTEFETATFEIDATRLVDWAAACGETDPRFVDPDHPDFQAHPNFTACLGTGRMLPEDFPRFGDGFGIDGGKTVDVHGPVRPGDTLTGRASVHDVYDKTGRSGTMVFIIHRMDFANEAGETVSTVDSKMIRRL